MNKKIWGNCLVKNEDRYLWFAVMSVINYLDKILIWDTGSTDNTVAIIKLLKDKFPKKIEFKQIGEVNPISLVETRQEMLEKTKSDWIFILDGDEVWWKDSIQKIVKEINGTTKLDYIVNPFFSVVGDIYHYQEEAAGKYHLAGRSGHLNIRAINHRIKGLHLEGDYPNEAFCDKNQTKIQDAKDMEAIYLEAPYLHFSNISRSSLSGGDKKVLQRSRKIRHEIGLKFADDFRYPEVLYLDRPDIVSNPWNKMSGGYRVRALIETPLRKMKREIK